MVTHYLATVIGWYLVITSLYLFTRFENAKAVMHEVMSHHGLFFFSGIITLILGLLLVASHNYWVMAWPVVITIFAWLVLIGGLIRLFYPEFVMKTWKHLIKNPNGIYITAAITFVFGLYLLYHVYY